MDEPFEAQLVEPLEAQVAAPPPKNAFGSIGSFVILFGVLGLAGLCFSGGFAALNYNATAPTPPPPNASAFQRFQFDLMNDMTNIAQRYTPALMAFSGWQVLVVILLIIGGVRVMRRTHSGRQFLLYVLLFTLLFEVLRAVMYVLMMMELLPFIDEGLVRAIRGVPNERAANVLKRVSLGLTLVMILVALVWPAMKILYFGWAAKYLASRQAIELCQTSS
jgi:hypothetical protein